MLLNCKMDNRTFEILKQISNLEESDGTGEVIWYWDKIKELELTEFDSYRIQRMLLEIGRQKGGETSSLLLKQFEDETTKIFTLSKQVKHLLSLTKPSKLTEELKLPFENLYINFDYLDEKEGFRLFGIYLNFVDKQFIEYTNQFFQKKTGKNFINAKNSLVTVSALIFSKKEGGFLWCDFIINLKTGKINDRPEKKKQEKKWREIQFGKKILKDLIINLLLFLNEPRITIYIQEPNNQRREKKGLIPIPSVLRTRIEIGLEEYIEKIYFNGLSHSKLGFSFWVRGHWRKFISPRFVNKQGQKIWIAPHIAGEGLMPPQVFEVTTR